MTADTVGGVFTHAAELIAGLRERAVEVVLVTFGAAARPAQRARIAEAAPAQWYESAGKLEWMSDPWDDLEVAQRWLLELEREHRPDVVHLNGFGHAAARWRAPVVVGAHSCVYSWWRAVHGRTPPAEWDRYRAWIRAGLDAADAVVAPTRAMLDALAREHGGGRGHRAVIHNGTSAPVACAPEKQPVVLAAGRLWDEAKNLALLADVATRMPPGTVRVAGDAGDRRADAHLTRLGMLDAEELAAERRRAAVFAAPARYEPFGLSILEAARDRCALVLGDIPSLREVWDDAATYVAPGDAATAAAVLARLLADPAQTARLGERAQRRSRRYGSGRMADRYRELYELVAR
ncbi:MAG: glycosyltransferase family 4 protein [Solirubrobacterales bacterium]|nr:glycosyltransferase family 4 protein [Solirubrobacterales bacterium]